MAATIAETDFYDASEPQLSSVTWKVSRWDNTDRQQEQETNWAKSGPQKETVTERSARIRNRLLVEGRVATAQSELHANSPANASVLSFDESTVLCVVEAMSGELRIHLPRVHFPEQLSYGMPLSIGVEEVDGIRRPVIRSRNPTKLHDAESAKLRKLIDEMD